MCDHCGCEDHHPENDTKDNHQHSDDHHHDKHDDHHAHKHGDKHGHSHHHRPKTEIRIEQDVLAHNRAHADELRRKIAEKDARLVNIIGSPGSGKTELLSKLIPLLDKAHPPVVVEGDLATDNDAKRIRATNTPVFQIETGTACHLTAHDVEHALFHLPSEHGAVIFVENVGNLVCPSMFDIGETLRIVCLSVTEGADKPEKYPVSFREANVAVITKSDLLPYVDFDTAHCTRLIADIHPSMKVIVTSAKDMSGMSDLAAVIAGLWNK
jgi:hydrogenase nickel incorporation protein HypB